jgi:hydroxymethylbilane synthase
LKTDIENRHLPHRKPGVMTPPTRPIRIATRASRLALWQAEHVAALMRQAVPGLEVQIVHVSTIGDRDVSGPLRSLGPFGVFTREVQRAVLDNQADLAVHSLKDLPTEPVPDLTLAAVPERGPQADALVLPATAEPGGNWDTLPAGACVGTGSLRRRAQLLHHRPDLDFQDVRGNVETRLRKLDEGEYQALVLAVAGLERLGLEARITQQLAPPLMYPAVGQGALGLECRTADSELRDILAKIDDPATHAAVTAERALLNDLEGGCHAPIGVHTEINDGQLKLEGVVLSPDGKTRLWAEAQGPVTTAGELGLQVAAALRAQGAEALIASTRT